MIGVGKKYGRLAHSSPILASVESSILLTLPRPPLTLRHHSSQDPVDPRLVTRAFGLEPIHHFDIHA
jgi:hypothetical protein